MREFRILPQAETDFTDIWLYIARGNIDAADARVDQFSEIFEVLRQSPELGPAYPDIDQFLRRFPVKNYLIFYTIRDEILIIERILQGARDIESLFE